MPYKVFVDGESGTTGLELRARLEKRPGFTLLHIAPEKRRDPQERRSLYAQADLVFLCLPDDAAREAASLAEGTGARLIDASTAHRVAPGWVYGFPELAPGQREKIASAARVAVPGCHATGFTSLVHPLVAGGILPRDYPLCCTSVSGYSGGGKKLIETYEARRHGDPALQSPRFYALGLAHKHLPEMQAVNGLAFPPVFTPMVGPYYRGMLVSVPLRAPLLAKPLDARGLWEYYGEYYSGEEYVRVMPFGGENALDEGFLDATGCNGTNRLDLFVFGGGEQALVVARLDNLGKGASGAAVQCMDLMAAGNARK